MWMSNVERQSFVPDRMRMKQEEERLQRKVQEGQNIGERKQVTDMTQREKRHQRKIWRVQKRKLKERRKAEQERILTPPSSPVTPEHQQGSSRQKKHEMNIQNGLRSKCYRDLKSKDREIHYLKRKQKCTGKDR
ncbi:hypothetical protein MAR_027274 [Mya arenaria]|uniref:Uncharacterized protein n=1 Tax=Mya arenaria TaxID=6604 RepID=A0ABY7EVF9_MYAAR|nr:hypothetical protein MAR_027274 [Mya arenaria]